VVRLMLTSIHHPTNTSNLLLLSPVLPVPAGPGAPGSTSRTGTSLASGTLAALVNNVFHPAPQ